MRLPHGRGAGLANRPPPRRARAVRAPPWAPPEDRGAQLNASAVVVVDTAGGAEALLPRLLAAEALAVDVESNGLFVYRPRLCTVQIAWEEAGEARVAVFDTLALGGAVLADVLGACGPVKILHDLSFDARLLADNEVLLDNVRDTSVAARFLGRTSLGLGNLLQGELQIAVDKGLQHHDWSQRPLTESHLVYLANDVRHLFALWEHLEAETAARGVGAFVATETAYKLSEAIRPPVLHPAPHLKVKGAADLPRSRLPLFRRLYAVRERLAREADLPPFKVLPPDVLVRLAREAPTEDARLARLVPARCPAAAVLDELATAIREGTADHILDEGERAVLDAVPPPVAVRKAEKRREDRLRGFRKRESVATGCDEQAILPGHCAKALAARGPTTIEELYEIDGLGEARILRWGAELLEHVKLPPEEAAAD